MRGMLRHLRYLMAYRLGLLQEFSAIDWTLVKRLVFVCKGNICRSPYAEAIAARHGMVTLSLGLDARSGSQANPDAIRNASICGTELGMHRAKSLHDISILETDLLIAMEPQQAATLKKTVKTGQITLLGIWAAKQPRPFLQDPYGCGDSYFQTCFSSIESSVRGLEARLKAASHYWSP